MRLIPIASLSPHDGVQLFLAESACLNVLLLGCPEVDSYGLLAALDGKIVGSSIERIGLHEGRHAQMMPTFSSTMVQSEETMSSCHICQRLFIALGRGA